MSVAIVLTMLASAVIVLGGLAALTRAIWKAAQDVRDNKRATQANTVAITELSVKMDGRITSLETRVSTVEGAIGSSLRKGP